MHGLCLLNCSFGVPSLLLVDSFLQHEYSLFWLLISLDQDIEVDTGWSLCLIVTDHLQIPHLGKAWLYLFDDLS